MRRAVLATFVAMSLVVVGCAKDVTVRWPASAEPTGTIDIVFTEPAKGVTIAVNGRLVSRREHTETVRVERVPVGVAEVIIAAGSGANRVEHHMRTVVEENQVTSIPVASPNGAISSSAAATFLSLGAYVAGKLILSGVLF